MFKLTKLVIRLNRCLTHYNVAWKGIRCKLFYGLSCFEYILCMNMLSSYLLHGTNSDNNIVSSLLTMFDDLITLDFL